MFSHFLGDDLKEVRLNPNGSAVGGVVDELFEFGGTSHDTDIHRLDGTVLPADGRATGQVFSSADGVTYGVGAEAPAGNPAIRTDPIGSSTFLVQEQTFVKRSEDASLTFTVSAVHVEATDLNAVLGRVCPEDHIEFDDLGTYCDLIMAGVGLNVSAWTPFVVDDPADPDGWGTSTKFFDVQGGVSLNGQADNWDARAWTGTGARAPLFDLADFELEFETLDGVPEGLVRLKLGRPITVAVDISSVAVGDEFRLLTLATAETWNRIVGPPSEFGSSATAYLRDPLGIGGTSVTSSGLEPIDTPDVDLPADVPVTPAPCASVPAPDPAAGVLQFTADRYTRSEASSTPAITVTRTGGSTGAVTATLTTTDGTAVAGTDYTPVHSSVFFADGDTTPRLVEVPTVADPIGNEPDKTVIVTLSEPGGCAALGSPSSTVLTIRDDDLPVPTDPDRHLDPTFGVDGRATSPGFGGDRSAMALEPDGKIVMVGGTFTDFVAARFLADGSLDPTFDTDGKVTTDIGGGAAQEEALGVAIQPDGKIVVVGYTDRTNVALVRYHPDGSLDTSFGAGGTVDSGVVGIAHDVALQPDGRIVVSGTRSLDSFDDGGDIVVARYLPDGRLDPSFTAGGTLTADVGGVTNDGRNVVVQADGAIVVSGSSPDAGGNGVNPSQHTDVARFHADGSPDTAFGTGGTTTLADTSAGADLVVQADGRFLLAGTADATVPPAPPGSVTDLSVVRLDRDGRLDLTFGAAGTATVPMGERAAASALALQADGSIVVAGTTGSINEDFAVARLHPDGALDTSFADAGTLSVDFSDSTDIAESVAVQHDGRIVVGGQARDDVDGYGLVRISP